jgi:hypothetical protein
MGHFSMEKPPNPGSVLGGNQQSWLAKSGTLPTAFCAGWIFHFQLQFVTVITDPTFCRDHDVSVDNLPTTNGMFNTVTKRSSLRHD